MSSWGPLDFSCPFLVVAWNFLEPGLPKITSLPLSVRNCGQDTETSRLRPVLSQPISGSSYIPTALVVRKREDVLRRAPRSQVGRRKNFVGQDVAGN